MDRWSKALKVLGSTRLRSRAHPFDAQNAHEINLFHSDSHWLAFVSMELVCRKSERPKRALIPEPATPRPASFGIRTADSDVNGFLRLLLNRIHLKRWYL